MAEVPIGRSASRAASRAPAGGPATRKPTGVWLLTVPGSPTGRIAVHLVAVPGVAGLLVATRYDWVGVAVFALVLGGMTAMRVLQLPAPLQVAAALAAQGAAWASVLHLYERIWWLAILVHLVLNGLLAGAAGVALHRARMTSSKQHRRGRWGLVITTTGVGAVMAVVWEIAEWFGHVYVDQRVQIEPGDTVGDLAAALLGSALAGLALARRRTENEG